MRTPHILFGLLFCLGYISLTCNCAGSNGSTLIPGKALIGGEKLVSSNGKFALGFFKSGASKSSHNTTLPNWYLGIWFNKIPKLTPVWVANRDRPITQPSLNLSKLIISGDGNLVILNHLTKSIIWSSRIASRTKASRETTAVLSDNGNLIILDNATPARVWWQSFENPTDVFLPGGKIGRNKITGKAYSFVSKKNLIDPASGIYCMELDPSGAKQYLVKLCNSSIVYFSTGVWNGKYFPSVPEMSGSTFAHAKFIDNEHEEYLTYAPADETMTTICVLDVSGLTKQLLWVEALQDWETVYIQPKAACDVFAVCGPFTVCNDNALPLCSCMEGFSVRSPEDWDIDDRRGGCMRITPLDCSWNKIAKEDTDKFYPIPGVRLPYGAHVMEAVASASDCKGYCLTNCTCTAYSYSKSVCSIWQGEILNVKQHSYTTNAEDDDILYLRLADRHVQSKENSGKRQLVIDIVIGASITSLVLLVLSLLSIIQRNKWKFFGHQNNIKDEGVVSAFRYVDLQRATKNFSEKLGGGGFGSVFKGMLSGSTTVAIKTLDGIRQGEKQFRAEVSTIGMIQHVNLVKLIGFCCEGDRRMLVYEYMQNRSLDVHLFQSGGAILNWGTRYQIAIGIAKGLSYLHESCRDCIIHCDVKPENILLDVSFVPKIADFGMAKLMGREFSRVLTTMRGTIGYLAPEWISGVPITQKVDVYSYGMVLLEIISGKRNTLEKCTSNDDHSVYFPVKAARTLHEGDLCSLVDNRIIGDINMEEVQKACKVACWCIQDNEHDRPTMGDVVQVLEGLVELARPPMLRLLRSMLGSSASTTVVSATPDCNARAQI
ncbi:hypothetical protein ACP4OV_029097 [Aristida adscensionis]